MFRERRAELLPRNMRSTWTGKEVAVKRLRWRIVSFQRTRTFVLILIFYTELVTVVQAGILGKGTPFADSKGQKLSSVQKTRTDTCFDMTLALTLAFGWGAGPRFQPPSEENQTLNLC